MPLTPSREKIDAVLRYLPRLEALGAYFGEMLTTDPPPHVHEALSEDVSALVALFYEDGWLLELGWPGWQDDAERYATDPGRIESADLVALQKLITVHLRKARFAAGYLLGIFESGLMTRILRRLLVLRGEIG
jgi:hypothetical protein